MDDIAYNTLESTLKMTLETSKEETDKKPEKLVPDPNEDEIVAKKKQTTMAFKKTKMMTVLSLKALLYCQIFLLHLTL